MLLLVFLINFKLSIFTINFFYLYLFYIDLWVISFAEIFRRDDFVLFILLFLSQKLKFEFVKISSDVGNDVFLALSVPLEVVVAVIYNCILKDAETSEDQYTIEVTLQPYSVHGRWQYTI